MFLRVLLLVLVVLCRAVPGAMAQHAAIKGLVKDSHNEEAIPFASVVFYPSRHGTVTDSAGMFYLHPDDMPIDSISISYVGYDKLVIKFSALRDTGINILALNRAVSQGVVVKAKANRGLILWRKVVRNKPNNDRSRFDNYYYEVHNKLELDLNRVNKDKLQDWKLMKPFGFVLDNIDTGEGGVPILPVYLAETMSDYYYQGSPKRWREVIKASKTIGVKNESVTRNLGTLYQNVNVYYNFIPVFDKQFVSPLSDNGDAYYHYTVPDTVVFNGRRFYHWVFTAKRKGENTFEGDAWIHDSTFAVQRIQLRLTGASPVNYIENLSVYQDYQLYGDTLWFLSKDKFIADIYPIGKNAFGFKGRKTTTYRNVRVNDSTNAREIARNKLSEEVIVLPGAEEKTDGYWTESRHEDLNRNEAAIYHMIDTLQSMPLFKKYTNTINFLATGYKPIGNYEIGPWFNWISLNAWEGLRMRFDLGTTPGFSKHMYLHGYLAYGFGDQKFKGKAEGYFLLKKNPRSYVHLTYLNDLDNGQNYYDEVSLDNIFSLAIRKPDVPIKFMKVRMQEAEYYVSNAAGLSAKIGFQRKVFDPLQNLPDASNFKSGTGDSLTNFESALTLRFAYLERFLEGNYFRTSLGSQYPIVELKYSRGWPGVMKSNYSYHKLGLRINDYVKIPPLGSLEYSLYAGKTWGTLPYMLLNVAPGNEIYYYNKYAFNLMNRFEFITDQYAGFGVEHNFGSGLFKYIGLTRRLKFRQFWNFKTLWGSLSEENKALNYVNGHPFTDLGGKAYAEIGTGVDNILRVLRFDLVWRLAPQPLPTNWVSRFGVFVSFRLAF